MPEKTSSNISSTTLRDHQTLTFNWQPGKALASLDQAIEFVNQRGFIFFWPIQGVHFPSLWSAVAGDRSVAAAHDDPGHVTWGWKDQMLDQRKWYYGKVLRGKATMISFDYVPYFYALSRNYGEPEQEYLELYHDGLLSQPAKRIFETIKEEGPLDTVTLRRQVRMTGKASNSPFERGLVELQRDFKILPVGIAQTGGWRYSFIYELVHRYHPDLVEAARHVSEREARKKLALAALRSLGAAEQRDLQRLFGWLKSDLEIALRNLETDSRIIRNVAIGGTWEPLIVLSELMES